MPKKISYHTSVNYAIADPAKVLAQKAGLATAKHLPFGFKEVEGTRGESAYVFDMGPMYGALVQEGLGTKSLIAQAVYEKTGRSFFGAVAQDTVATFVNDLISVGATPVVSNAYWSASSYNWLADRQLTKDFINGWRRACDEAEMVWGGGETQSLPGIVKKGALEFAGSAFGVIKPKKRLVSQQNLQSGDAIVLIASSGVHANGISLAREVAERLPKGYQTRLPSGQTYGEVLLAPTHLYWQLVRGLFEQGLHIHYFSNITGHGWRKLMRADRRFSYLIETLPPVPEIFDFIAQHSGNNDRDMYSTYNMGAGYAVYLPAKEAETARRVARKLGLKAWLAGNVQTGPRRVIIKPKNITFEGQSLGVRG